MRGNGPPGQIEALGTIKLKMALVGVNGISVEGKKYDEIMDYLARHKKFEKTLLFRELSQVELEAIEVKKEVKPLGKKGIDVIVPPNEIGFSIEKARNDGIGALIKE